MRRGGEGGSRDESHRLSEGIARKLHSQKKSESERERETQMAREEGDREKEGKLSLSLHAPASFPSARLAVLAIPCSGEERLLKPSPGSHVWTQSLLLPC